jgi:hypothetical protein
MIATMAPTLPAVTVDRLIRAAIAVLDAGGDACALNRLWPYLSDTDIAALLDIGVRSENEFTKAAVLARLVPRVNAEQRPVLLGAVGGLTRRYPLITLIAAVLPLLAADRRAVAVESLFELLAGVGSSVHSIVNKVADHLDEDELDRLASRYMSAEHVPKLSWVVARLRPARKVELFTSLRSVDDGNLAAIVLGNLAVGLDADAWGAAIDTATAIADPAARARAYLNLASHLPERHDELITLAVDTIVAVPAGNRLRSMVISMLIPHLNPAQGLRIGHLIVSDPNPTSRYQIGSLAPALDPDGLAYVLDTVAPSDPDTQLYACACMLPYVSGDLRTRTIAGIAEALQPPYAARLGMGVGQLAEAALHLDRTEMAMVVDAVLTWPGPRRRSGIARFAAHVRGDHAQVFFDIAMADDDVEFFTVVLAGIYPAATPDQRPGILRTMAAIENPQVRVFTFLGIAERVDHSDIERLIDAAITTAAQIVDPDDRTRMLITIAERTPPDDRGRILSMAFAALPECSDVDDRSRILDGIATLVVDARQPETASAGG